MSSELNASDQLESPPAPTDSSEHKKKKKKDKTQATESGLSSGLSSNIESEDAGDGTLNSKKKSKKKKDTDNVNDGTDPISADENISSEKKKKKKKDNVESGFQDLQVVQPSEFQVDMLGGEREGLGEKKKKHKHKHDLNGEVGSSEGVNTAAQGDVSAETGDLSLKKKKHKHKNSDDVNTENPDDNVQKKKHKHKHDGDTGDNDADGSDEKKKKKKHKTDDVVNTDEPSVGDSLKKKSKKKHANRSSWSQVDISQLKRNMSQNTGGASQVSQNQNANQNLNRGSTTNFNNNRPTQKSKTSIHERLYNSGLDSIVRKQRSSYLKAVEEGQEAQYLANMNNVSDTSRDILHQNGYKKVTSDARLKEHQNRKKFNDIQKEKREEQEVLNHCTFKPEITEKAQNIENKNVYKRQKDFVDAFNNKMTHIRKSDEERLAQQCTFQPFGIGNLRPEEYKNSYRKVSNLGKKISSGISSDDPDIKPLQHSAMHREKKEEKKRVLPECLATQRWRDYVRGKSIPGLDFTEVQLALQHSNSYFTRRNKDDLSHFSLEHLEYIKARGNAGYGNEYETKALDDEIKRKKKMMSESGTSSSGFVMIMNGKNDDSNSPRSDNQKPRLSELAGINAKPVRARSVPVDSQCGPAFSGENNAMNDLLCHDGDDNSRESKHPNLGGSNGNGSSEKKLGSSGGSVKFHGGTGKNSNLGRGYRATVDGTSRSAQDEGTSGRNDSTFNNAKSALSKRKAKSEFSHGTSGGSSTGRSHSTPPMRENMPHPKSLKNPGSVLAGRPFLKNTTQANRNQLLKQYIASQSKRMHSADNYLHMGQSDVHMLQKKYTIDEYANLMGFRKHHDELLQTGFNSSVKTARAELVKPDPALINYNTAPALESPLGVGLYNYRCEKGSFMDRLGILCSGDQDSFKKHVSTHGHKHISTHGTAHTGGGVLLASGEDLRTLEKAEQFGGGNDDNNNVGTNLNSLSSNTSGTQGQKFRSQQLQQGKNISTRSSTSLPPKSMHLAPYKINTGREGSTFITSTNFDPRKMDADTFVDQFSPPQRKFLSARQQKEYNHIWGGKNYEKTIPDKAKYLNEIDTHHFYNKDQVISPPDKTKPHYRKWMYGPQTAIRDLRVQVNPGGAILPDSVFNQSGYQHLMQTWVPPGYVSPRAMVNANPLSLKPVRPISEIDVVQFEDMLRSKSSDEVKMLIRPSGLQHMDKSSYEISGKYHKDGVSKKVEYTGNIPWSAYSVHRPGAPIWRTPGGTNSKFKKQEGISRKEATELARQALKRLREKSSTKISVELTDINDDVDGNRVGSGQNSGEDSTENSRLMNSTVSSGSRTHKGTTKLPANAFIPDPDSVISLSKTSTITKKTMLQEGKYKSYNKNMSFMQKSLRAHPTVKGTKKTDGYIQRFNSNKSGTSTPNSVHSGTFGTGAGPGGIVDKKSAFNMQTHTQFKTMSDHTSGSGGKKNIEFKSQNPKSTANINNTSLLNQGSNYTAKKEDSETLRQSEMERLGRSQVTNVRPPSAKVPIDLEMEKSSFMRGTTSSNARITSAQSQRGESQVGSGVRGESQRSQTSVVSKGGSQREQSQQSDNRAGSQRGQSQQGANRAGSQRGQSQQSANGAGSQREQSQQSANRVGSQREQSNRGDSQRGQSQQSANRAGSQRGQSQQSANRADSQRGQSQQSAVRAESQREQSQQSAVRAESQREQSQQSAVRAESQREQSQQSAVRAESQREQSQQSVARAESQREQSQHSVARAESQREQSQHSVARAESQREQSQHSVARAESQREPPQDGQQDAQPEGDNTEFNTEGYY